MADEIKPQEPKAIVVPRLKFIAQRNREIADSCEKIITLLEEHPELDADFCNAFGLNSTR